MGGMPETGPEPDEKSRDAGGIIDVALSSGRTPKAPEDPATTRGLSRQTVAICSSAESDSKDVFLNGTSLTWFKKTSTPRSLHCMGCSHEARQVRFDGRTAWELGEEKGADLRSFFRGRVLSACALRVVASSVAFREEAPFRRCPPPVAPLLPF